MALLMAMAPAMLPQGGQPLQPLPRLNNLSDTAGRLRSALAPAPHAMQRRVELTEVMPGRVSELPQVRHLLTAV